LSHLDSRGFLGALSNVLALEFDLMTLLLLSIRVSSIPVASVSGLREAKASLFLT